MVVSELLLRGVTSKHNGDYLDFCNLKKPDENNKILKHVSGEISLKVSFVIYADLGCS